MAVSTVSVLALRNASEIISVESAFFFFLLKKDTNQNNQNKNIKHQSK